MVSLGQVCLFPSLLHTPAHASYAALTCPLALVSSSLSFQVSAGACILTQAKPCPCDSEEHTASPAIS